MAQTNLSRRDSLKTARRFNAGIGLDGASSPGGTAENARPFRPSLRDPVLIASQPGVETPGYCRSSLRDKTPARQKNLSKLRRSDLFVENRPAQDSQLRRSGIVLWRDYVAPTELKNLLMALTTKIPLLRSYKMALARI
jgi:hypothetical protein